MPTTKGQKLVILGASGHAQCVAECAVAAGFDVLGFTDPALLVGTALRFGPVLGSESTLTHLQEQHPGLQVVVGVGDNHLRMRITQKVSELFPKLEWATVLHPSSVLAPDVTPPVGLVMMPGATVRTGGRLGQGLLLNTGCIVDHDAQLDDFASVGPGATLGGTVQLGELSAVSIGATVLHQCKIGAHTVVGGGALVTGDLPANVVAYGVPAKVVRVRGVGEPYLQRK